MASRIQNLFPIGLARSDRRSFEKRCIFARKTMTIFSLRKNKKNTNCSSVHPTNHKKHKKHKKHRNTIVLKGE